MAPFYCMDCGRRQRVPRRTTRCRKCRSRFLHRLGVAHRPRAMYGEFRKTSLESLDDPVSRVQMRETLDYSLRRMMLTVFKKTRLIPTWDIQTIISRPGYTAVTDPLCLWGTIGMKMPCEPPILEQPGNYNKLRRMGWPN